MVDTHRVDPQVRHCLEVEPRCAPGCVTPRPEVAVWVVDEVGAEEIGEVARHVQVADAGGGVGVKERALGLGEVVKPAEGFEGGRREDEVEVRAPRELG